MSRILKWHVPLDDRWHPIGTGKVALVDQQAVQSNTGVGYRHVATVWTIEFDDQGLIRPDRLARVYGTGQYYPSEAEHLGSYQVGGFVWHVVAVEEKPDE